MRVRDVNGWPPQWATSGPYIPFGQSGRLKAVRLKRNSIVQLEIEYKGNEASGGIDIDDQDLRQKLLSVLEKNVGREINDIAGLELD